MNVRVRPGAGVRGREEGRRGEEHQATRDVSRFQIPAWSGGGEAGVGLSFD